jgi:hypothetical protein
MFGVLKQIVWRIERNFYPATRIVARLTMAVSERVAN